MSQSLNYKNVIGPDTEDFADSFCKGDKAVVCGFKGCEDSERLLRRMGFCEGVTVQWVQGNRTALVRCGNCKVAVEGDLLQSLQVIKKKCCKEKSCWKCYLRKVKRFFICSWRGCRHKRS
jgi:Fe2+ transport system protein FeoA